jgi:hypothetical protein
MWSSINNDPAFGCAGTMWKWAVPSIFQRTIQPPSSGLMVGVGKDSSGRLDRRGWINLQIDDPSWQRTLNFTACIRCGKGLIRHYISGRMVKTAPDGNEWSASHFAHFTPPRRKSPWYPFNGWLGGSPIASVDMVAKRTTLSLLRIELWPSRPQLVTILTELSWPYWMVGRHVYFFQLQHL